MKGAVRKIHVNDLIQHGYEYECVEPVGRNFAADFKPMLSPQEMLELGVFGGRYMRDCVKEFPSAWFAHARLLPQGTPGHDPMLNYFGVEASQPLEVWRKKSWINEKHDPRGWFQWYCRYYMGRRLPEEDARQIRRWKQMVRHIAQIKNNCRPGDMSCHPRQRQALLHWAYDSRRM